jgi:hypothetical protein
LWVLLVFAWVVRESCWGRFVVLRDGYRYTNGLLGKEVLVIAIE